MKEELEELKVRMSELKGIMNSLSPEIRAARDLLAEYSAKFEAAYYEYHRLDRQLTRIEGRWRVIPTPPPTITIWGCVARPAVNAPYGPSTNTRVPGLIC